MKTNYLKNCLKSVLMMSILSFSISGIAQTKTYDFESDVAGSNPANVSSANGTFTTNYDATRTKTLNLLTSNATNAGDNTAIVNLDLFPSIADYSVTWKENYTTALGRAGMLLRGGTLTSTANPGLKEGYLFQANPGQGNMRIFKVAAAAYTGLTNVAVAAPALGANRWYRATVKGSSLKFEYSNDGTAFTVATTTTDATYASAGLTQYASGYGLPIGNVFVDNIVYTPIVANLTYDFESDVAGSNPANVSAASGTFTTNYDATRTKTLNFTALASTLATDNTAAVNLDLFPSAADYSVTWKENYILATSATITTPAPPRSGVLLRGSGANSANTGIKQGYLFQPSSATGQLRYYKSGASGFGGTITKTLAARGENLDRWYRATASGSYLTFDYSDDGVNFTNVITTTDATYTAGTTQFVVGFGQPITGLFVDNIVYTPIGGTTSVAKNELKNLTLYPNPAKNTVKLLLDNNGETATGSIYDVQGRLVMNIDKKLENNLSIDVSSLTKGVYFFKIQSASSKQTKKLIIE